MGVDYGQFSTPLVHGLERGIWKPGYRCPDVIITKGSGEATRLYSNVSYGRFIVLSIGTHLDIEPVSATIYTILPKEMVSGGNGYSKCKDCDETFTADWVEARTSHVVVVRPDMYIGCVSNGTKDEAWRAYLQQYDIKSQ
jgi:hypothetical protein